MPTREELRRDFIALPRGAARVAHLPAFGIEPAPHPADAAEALRALGPCVAAIGAFDGVHRGHVALLEAAAAEARERGMAAVAVTFDPDPDTVVAPRPDRKLTLVADRLRLLSGSGVDAVAVIPFSAALAALDAGHFFSEVLLPVLDVRSIHVGSNFRLGRGGASAVTDIATWCSARGIEVHGHDLVLDDGAPISSTRIRARLAAGDLASAERELGRRYLLRGRVHTGRGEGTGMGFPTANILVDPALQVPAEGVYSGLALVEGTVWPAAINVGKPPTFRDRPGSASLEANLIGFSGDIYGDEFSLVFAERLRGLVRFDSVDELVRTVLGNIQTVREAFDEEGVRLA